MPEVKRDNLWRPSDRAEEERWRTATDRYRLRCETPRCKVCKVCDCKFASHFAPIQLGVGTPGGAEAAIHALRRYAEYLPKDYVIVKLDFKNAFNTLRRDTMLKAVRREIPELYNFISATHNGATVLQFGELYYEE